MKIRSSTEAPGHKLTTEGTLMCSTGKCRFALIYFRTPVVLDKKLKGISSIVESWASGGR